MAKSRPPASSKTERKGDAQETTALKSPPSPATGTAKDVALSEDPAPSKTAEESDSPTPHSAAAAVPAATPIPDQTSAQATAPPVTGGPEPKPGAETGTAGAKPFPTVQRAAENG